MITPIAFLMDFYGNDIFIKRDDLLPFSFGGNKARIAKQFVDDMFRKQKNCMVGYGNVRSNLSRALSNMCFSKGIPCHIISPSDDDGKRNETFNSMLVKNCEVNFHICNKDNVSNTVENVIKECETLGLMPYYIYGDKYGKGNEYVPVNAYYEAYSEIVEQSSSMDLDYDYLFLATGTGMTQSGLIAGRNSYGRNEKIVGISIARDSRTETQIIKNYLDSFRTIKNFSYVPEDIIVDDRYLCGGYGKYNSEIGNTIMSVYKKNGIPLDPTYSGKAFTGMLRYVKDNCICGKKIIFLHTGGTPLFYDYLLTRSDWYDIDNNVSFEQLRDFVVRVDTLLPTSLSSRVNIDKYCEKILRFGRVSAIIIDNRVVSAALYYCNDSKTHDGYMTLLATLPEYSGKGLANLVINNMETTAANCGMKRMKTETDLINTKAIALYSKCGYLIDYVSDKVHMVKEIS